MSADSHAPAPQPRHLVTVWNPLYAREVEQHLSTLIGWAKQLQDGRVGDDDVYVWWGKVKSPNRQQPLRNADDIRDIAEELARGSRDGETHLYVTDYRSLYVGELLAVHEGELHDGENGHVPAYYGIQRLSCDFWFKLGDLRRLVRDDLPEVARELQRLRNVHYNHRPVSLYGGMVDIPLVVTRPDGRVFFDPDERDALTEDRLWVEFDAERGAGVADMQRELRRNVLGDEAWEALELTARTTLADAERTFRDHRDDAAYDFAGVLMGFAKAIEIQCNMVLRTAAARLPLPLRTTNVDGTTLDLAKARGLTIGQLARAIAGERERFDALTRILLNGKWFTEQLPPVLEDLARARNPAVHEGRVSRDEATRWRNRILGVGSQALLVDLARTQLRTA